MRAAGADLDKVYFWDFHPTFPEKLAQLEHIIEQLGIVLVVLDPFLAFLDDDIDSYKDQNIRQVLTPLSKMAERTGCAVLLIRHLNKSSAQVNKMYKGSGSIAVVAAARVCLYMLQDEDTGDRILGQVKNNLAPTQASWAFEFLEGANWQDTRLNWKGRSEL
jgi:RecA-family ATPase